MRAWQDPNVKEAIRVMLYNVLVLIFVLGLGALLGLILFWEFLDEGLPGILIGIIFAVVYICGWQWRLTGHVAPTQIFSTLAKFIIVPILNIKDAISTAQYAVGEVQIQREDIVKKKQAQGGSLSMHDGASNVQAGALTQSIEQQGQVSLSPQAVAQKPVDNEQEVVFDLNAWAKNAIEEEEDVVTKQSKHAQHK